MHKSAEIIRRAYEAFNAADMKVLAETFDENCSWHTPGQGSISGDRVGRAEVFAQFGRCGREHFYDLHSRERFWSLPNLKRQAQTNNA